MEYQPSNRGEESVSLDDVLITGALSRRPSRPPNYEAENVALTTLVGEMAGSPEMILKRAVEVALDLCRADSAGISILEPGAGEGEFRWRAVAGQFVSNAAGVMPRELSPCGVVLDRGASLLFSYPERHFKYGKAIDPPVVEALLAPFHIDGKPAGALWAIAHTPSRQFDTEDQRALISLSRFASMAYELRTASRSSGSDVEQRFRLALDASGAGSWVRDARTGSVDWDDRLRRLYGFAADEPASFEIWLSRVHEEDRRQVIDLIDSIERARTQHIFDCTFRIVRPDGTVRWIECFGHADRDAEGRVMRFTGIELDVTQRRLAEEASLARRDQERDRTFHKQAEEALRRSHAELERRTLQLGRLASQLTLAEQTARKQLASTLHDGLQQLLFSAVITLDQAVNATIRDVQVDLLQRARADVMEAVEAARTLSVNLFPPVLQVGGLPAALAWLAKRMKEQYGVVVNVVADPRANPEASDVRILLFEGARELLFNAVKHAHVDRVEVKLALGPDGSIHIEVSDQGVGFDPDVTLSLKNQHQAGLGLFSIRERFALLGGRLDIQSAPGKGARFSLILPQTGPAFLAAAGSSIRRDDTVWKKRPVLDPAAAGSTSLRILIADDHAVTRGGLRDLFSQRPQLHVVGEAVNGVEAISQATTLQPDVVVMDVSMRHMDGIEATREIHRVLPHVRIVGLSTHDDESTERSMREAGAEAYFTKNEGTDRLLDYLLSLRAQEQEASGL